MQRRHAKKLTLFTYYFRLRPPQFPDYCMLHVQSSNVQGNCKNEV